MTAINVRWACLGSWGVARGVAVELGVLVVVKGGRREAAM